MSNTELYYAKQQAIKPNIEIISVSCMLVMITYWHIPHQSRYDRKTYFIIGPNMRLSLQFGLVSFTHLHDP
jgi:hypothetical protein